MKKLFLLAFTILLSALVFGQPLTYDQDASLALDPKVVYGELDNGLTYYIRENKKPENRAEFYLVVNVGAVLEDDDQNGLAHFCEHMAFNGTEHFEKKEILDYLQSIGMKFGPEINAFTSHDVTTYMLQKVPIEVPENIDTALLVLYDWAGKASFEDEEIDKERGVIHEEWRTRRGAQFRMMNEAQKTIFKGSKYAERDVIGEIDIIDNCEYETLRSFYRDWYRPDLEAIIAVGDFDVQLVEQKIKDLFSKAVIPENARTREYFELPDHPETLVTVQTDKEAQYSMLQVIYKHDIEKNKNMGYYRKSVLENLYNTMLNARLQELLLTDDPPFIYGISMYTNLVRTKDAYIAFAVAKDDQMDRALESILIENERVREHGFAETELERAKKDLMSELDKQYKERDKQESDKYVWQYYDHFLNNEPVPGIEFEYEFVKEVLPGIKLEEINKLAKEWITDENRVVTFMAPEKEGLTLPSEEEILGIVAGVSTMEIAPYVDKVSDKPLMQDEPVPAKVSKVKKDKKLETVSWTFENGVRVVLKPTDFKEDEILMTAFSFGGTSLYPVKDLVSADFASTITSMSGIGEFDQVELDKKMAGKIINVYPGISKVYESLGGNSSPKDLETMLQLIYLYFTASRQDETSFNSFMSRYQGILENKALNPSSSLWDTVTVTMANYNPRVRPMTAELLDEANLKKMRYIYKERFGDPGGFTFYFVGNIDPDEVQPLFEKYLGGLPVVSREENWKDNGVRPPEGKLEKTVLREMEVPKSTVYISYTGTYDFDDYQNRMDLSALCGILDIRYVETVREEEGGTYGVRVRPIQKHYPYEHYQVNISFDCDPGNVDNLKAIIYQEIEKLQDEGPTAKDLNSVKENKLKTHQENLKENKYWLNKLKNQDFHNTDKSILTEYEEYVQNLTIESIQQAANKYFGDHIVEIILMPENISDNVVNPLLKEE